MEVDDDVPGHEACGRALRRTPALDDPDGVLAADPVPGRFPQMAAAVRRRCGSGRRGADGGGGCQDECEKDAGASTDVSHGASFGRVPSPAARMGELPQE